MKTLLMVLSVITTAAHATLLGLVTIKQPLYLQDAAGDEGIIKIADVQFVTANSNPEAEFAAISHPFIPPTDGSWKNPSDVNLCSLYAIGISAVREAGGKLIVTVDASKARVPEGFAFSVKQVVAAVVTCVKEVGKGHKMSLKIVPEPE